MSDQTFSWPDYLIFGIVLAISSAVGIYYRFTGLRQRTTNEVFLGDRKMTLLPVTFSIMASFMSAIAILGTAAEVYQSGVQYFMIGTSYFIVFPIAAEIFMPVFYRLQLISIHEYLELRFSKLVRYATSAIFIVQMILYISVVLYAPSLAFSQVSGLPMWLSILSTGIVCTFYTALGGMKAVMWTDLFQVIIMLCGLSSVLILGTIHVGGPVEMIKRANEGGRLNWFNFNPDPLERHTFWSLLIGGSGMVMTIYATNQAQVQRYLSCRTFNTARLSLWLNIPITLLFLFVEVASGLVAYAYYSNCDPLLNKVIAKRDQIIPQLVLELFSQYPGIPGLYLSCIFSAALSTISSGINSLATVFMVDIVQPIYKFKSRKSLSESLSTIASKIVAVIFGVCTIGLAFLFSVCGSTVLQIALSIFGMIGGPILAVFTLGLFHPLVNAKGALVGLLFSLVVSGMLGFGSIFGPKSSTRLLPVSVTNCTSTNNDSLSALSSTLGPQTVQGKSLFQLSYLYYSAVALSVATISAYLVSVCTDFNKGRSLSESLFYPPAIRVTRYIFKSIPLQFHSSSDQNHVLEKYSQPESMNLRKFTSGDANYQKVSEKDSGNVTFM